MEETLRSVRRIYYLLMAVCGALLAIVLSPPRDSTYREALEEVNAMRNRRWSYVKDDLIAEAKKEHYGDLGVTELWLRIFPKEGAPNSFSGDIPHKEIAPVYVADTLSPTTVGNVDAIIRENAIVSVIQVDTSDTAMARVRNEIETICSRQRRLLFFRGRRPHSMQEPQHSWSLQVADTTHHRYFGARCGFTADIPKYDFASHSYSWRLFDGVTSRDIVINLATAKSRVFDARVMLWMLREDSVRHVPSTHMHFDKAHLLWDEIEKKSLEAAAFALETHLEANRRQVTFLGLNFDEDVALTVGPALVILLLVYFRTYLLHLRWLLEQNVEQRLAMRFPWAPLLGSTAGGLTALLMLLALPFAAVFSAAIRSHSRLGTILQATTLASVGAAALLGLNLLIVVDQIRSYLQRPVFLAAFRRADRKARASNDSLGTDFTVKDDSGEWPISPV